MPNVTVPAAATGLPEETAVLAETDRGLAVVRPAGLKALRPTFLDGDALDAFLKTLGPIDIQGSFFAFGAESMGCGFF